MDLVRVANKIGFSLMFEKRESLDVLREMNDLQARYSENDF